MVDRIIALARKEIGTVEFPPNSNNVKYNTEYYGGKVNNPKLHWCAVFIWWLFRELGISELYYGGGKTAYVPTLLGWARQEGLVVDEPRPGDLVCFDFRGNGKAGHIGLCEHYDGQYVTTIDGNTGVGNEANGGTVMERRRHRKYIVAVIRPRYEEVENMTDEKFDEMMKRWLAKQGEKSPSAAWQKKGLDGAKEAGVTDGSRPMALCTRLEAAMMAAKAKK